MTDHENISVGFVSLGCSRNLVDSEVIADSLAAAGFALAQTPDCADIVVVNTCAFIHDAREESIDAVLQACELKNEGPCRAVIVAGCLPQRYNNQLASALPEVDAFIGVDEVGRAGEVAARIAAGERRIMEISKPPQAVIEPSPKRLIFTGAPYAYIRISDGCHHACSFCAIPRIRGRYRSRPAGNILREAEELLNSGVRELNLVSQDATSYGRDLASNASLSRLLRELGRLGGKFWIRVLYGHPGGVSPDLLEAMAEIPQACHYLDLPIQHGDSAVLRAMGRKETAEDLRKTFAAVRAVLPDAVLRTTCMAGFPGETEKRFENLLAFLKEIRFDHVGVFEYSRESNTPAARLRAPPVKQAKERRARLLSVQRRIVREKGRERIGHSDVILVERPYAKKRNTWIGRSRALAPEVDGVVFLETDAKNIAPGAFVKARYIGCRGYDMLAAG